MFYIINKHFLVVVSLIFLALMAQITSVNGSFPQIITQTQNLTLNLSALATLTCHVMNLGDHHVTWLKIDPKTSTSIPLAVGQQIFTPDKRYSVSSYPTSTIESYWILEIYPLNLNDEGIYECKIANRRASVNMRINLQVQIPMIIRPTRLYVEPGSNVELDCSIYTLILINQNLSLPITWHFNPNSINQTTTKTKRLHLNHHEYLAKQRYSNNMSTSILTIRQAQPHHSGLWTCVYNRQKRSARLLVEKGIRQYHHDYERSSALLANNSPRPFSTTSLVLFALWLGHHTTRRWQSELLNSI